MTSPKGAVGLALLRPFFNRPFIVTAMLGGVGLYFAAIPWVPHGVTRALIGWDCGVAIFLSLICFVLRRANPEEIKRMAAEYNEGGRAVLVLTILASVTSVGARWWPSFRGRRGTPSEVRALSLRPPP